MNADYLAFDLGAESGRALVGRLRSGVLDVQVASRFSNQPVNEHTALRWNVLRLWSKIEHAIAEAGVEKLDSIGLDTWGVDYALIGEGGRLLENPYHYRDQRTAGAMEEVCARVSRDRIYSITGIQFLPFNTLYQLYVASRLSPRLLAAADSLVTIPDLFNYWLTGELATEYTNATTTQFLDARSRTWATGLLDQLEIPSRLLTRIVAPGTVLGGLRLPLVRSGTPVVVPACHDTGSAVAAISTGDSTAFLSSGTWSLLGAEVPEPIISQRAQELNFTNEGGVCGTIRLLKNIGGLWLLQSCRRCWATDGREYSYEELLEAAAAEPLLFESLIDPDHASFLNPPHMPSAISAFCRSTEQPSPESASAFARTILVSLAFKYRAVLESLEELTGNQYSTIRIIGGGAKNRLLNQFTANATGRTVIAGPVEATALGNLAMQMLATGAVASLKEARSVIDRSFPAEEFRPEETGIWQSHYSRFQQYLG